jgi:hypothetical protein
MSARYDYYNTGDDAHYHLYNWEKIGERYYATTGHFITGIKVKLHRVGTSYANKVYCYLYSTNGGLPSTQRASGYIIFNDISTSTSGTWYEITFNNPYKLNTGELYAFGLYFSAQGSDSINVAVHYDTTPAYSNGQYVFYDGSNWSTSTSYDVMFEDWGTPLPTYKGLTGGISSSGILTRNFKLPKTGTLTPTGTVGRHTMTNKTGILLPNGNVSRKTKIGLGGSL